MLLMAAYFAMFYTPIQISNAVLSYAARPLDYAFHHRMDEADMLDKKDIAQMAAEEGIILRDYQEVPFANLTTDGYDREWTEDGRFGNEYHAFYAEKNVLSASAFQAITGQAAEMPSGQYCYVTASSYRLSPYDYGEEIGRFTNPDTMQVLPVSYHSTVFYDMLHGYLVLNDGDYAVICAGLTDSWQEKWVQFNTDNAPDTYQFASRLRNAIIDHSSEKSAVYENYDRIERYNAHAAGLAYRGDTASDLQVSYEDRESSQFQQYWKYPPQFRIWDQQNFILRQGVFLMLFVFIAIICMAAVIVIAYTRCLTIAAANQQVFEDLRHLGAKRDYLYRAVRGQVSRVFFVPALIGAIGIFGFFLLLLYANSGSYDAGEQLAILVNACLLALMSLLLWRVYRITLNKVSRILACKAEKPLA